MRLALFALLPALVYAQSNDAEMFSDALIDFFLASDEAELEALEYHEMLGTFDSAPDASSENPVTGRVLSGKPEEAVQRGAAAEGLTAEAEIDQ
ncbi:MAG: hypothetical protein WBN40_00230 [Pseudomonadales bacterium]